MRHYPHLPSYHWFCAWAMAFANGFHADDAVRKEIDALSALDLNGDRGHIVLIVLKAVCSRFTERSLAWAGYWNLYSCSGRFWYWSVLPCADGLVLDSRKVPGSCRLTFIIGSDPKVSVAERPVVLPRQPKRRATCLSLAFLLHQPASRHICLVCHDVMILLVIQPGSDGQDNQTFKCRGCGQSATVAVHRG